LQEHWPHPAYFNLYGPTETNVCTYHPIPRRIPDDRVDPYPIGKVCSHLRDLLVDADGAPQARDAEGELCIAGPAVMRGYWNDAAQTGSRFVEMEGERWYRTGDLVRRDAAGDWVYVGRRDRMVKKRGYRVELGEIEACLARYAEVLEVAVVAIPDEEAGLLVRAHLATEGGKRLSAIKLKQFWSEHLPVYMVPDQFDLRPSLPKTSTGKMDYRTLAG
jgi:acyl-coenzyme A synthetase/AMP-(fatty) acid ligase